jgi:serine phosphatase RsbU (regulator of sigma subunit)/tetratricopeptide (TPR) repeat protein
LKTLLPDDSQLYLDSVLRFRQELLALSHLKHPGIVRVEEAGEADGKPYLVMEFLDGMNLKEALAAGPFDEARAIAIAIQIAKAVGEVHRQKFIHRDIKPENIVLDGNGQPRLVDFGMVLSLNAGTSAAHSATVGTLAYSAPEQTGLVAGPVSEAVDLYSLGVVLFEMLSGTSPFPDESRISQMKVNSEIPDLRAAQPKASAVIAQIVTKLMQSDPTARYSSATALIADLENIKNPGAARRVDSQNLRLVDGNFVGRKIELERLQALWSATAEDKGASVYLEGDPGIGKTRLLTQFQRQATNARGYVLYTRCSRIGAVAMSPILDLLKTYFNEIWHQPEDRKNRHLRSLRALPAATLQALAQASDELADLLKISLKDHSQSREVFIQNLIQAFAWIARENAGLILCVEEVQWIDESSLDFFKRLGREISELPILVLCAGQGETEFLSLARTPEWSRLHLQKFTPEEGRSVLSAWLGLSVDEKTTEKILAPTSGIASDMYDYVTAMVEAGVLTASSGQVRLNEARLSEVGLSSDASARLRDRMNALPEKTRQILLPAAVWGTDFNVLELGSLVEESPAEIQSALQAAQNSKIIELNNGGKYVFANERFRDAFLALGKPAQICAFHQSAFLYLSSFTDRKPEQINSLALHAIGMGESGDVEHAVEAINQGGELAERRFAHKAAYDLLKHGYERIQKHRLQSSAARKGRELLGIACANTSRYEEALNLFDELIAQTTDNLSLARYYYWKAKVDSSYGRAQEGWQSFLVAMRAAGRRYPTNTVVVVVHILYYLTLNIWRIYFPREPKAISNSTREKLNTLAELLEIGVHNSFIRLSSLDLALQTFIVHDVGYRLGTARELLSGLGLSGALYGNLGLEKLMDKNFEQAFKVADMTGDEISKLFFQYRYLFGMIFANRMDDYEEGMAEFLPKAEKLFPPFELSAILVVHAAMLGQQGRFKEAADFYQQKMILMDETRNRGMMADFRAAYASRLESLGRREEAAELRAESQRIFETIKDSNPNSRAVRNAVLIHDVAEGVFEVDNEAERRIKEYLDLDPRGYFTLSPYAWHVQLRLNQYEIATNAEEKALRREQFRSGLKHLLRRQKSHLILSNAMAFQAAEARIDGRFDRALKLIEDAEALGAKVHNDHVFFYGAVERARLGRAKGSLLRTQIEAHAAYDFAEKREWRARLQLLEKEFGKLSAEPKPNKPAAALIPQKPGLNRERAMNALLEISAAASRSIDPMIQSRGTLDTVVNLLGAERACIFLGSSSSTLKFFLGRTADREDMLQIKGFSTTVVRKVVEERKPLIITGTAQGEAIGSKSIVAHNLKSIMVVPLVLAEDIKGVIYLDSSISRGLFSEADLDLFMAVSTQIASSIQFSELTALENERQEMKRELEISANVQKLFLPENTDCDLGSVAFTAFYRPATQCGGDWWWYKTQNSKLYVLVGDVGGHGIGPAMITASIASAYKVWQNKDQIDIKELILSTNRHLFDVARGEHYMVMAGCEIDLKSHLIRHWSAGAPLMLVQNRRTQESSYLGEPGELLGAGPNDIELGYHEYQAVEGDRLFIYSDGISEMVDANGRPLSDRRLSKILAQFKDHDVHRLKDDLTARLDEIRGANPQADDFTFVAIDINRAAP